MAKKKFKRFYNYKCSLTEETFKVTSEAPNPEDLMSVKAYYQLHPEHDDRPEYIKKQAEVEEANAKSSNPDVMDELENKETV
jgi:hypothetical protein